MSSPLRLALQVLVAGAVVVLLWSGLLRAEPFKPKSSLPPQLRDIAEDHVLDQSCGVEGDADKAKNQAQNRAKNNFYVTGTPVTITYNVLMRLQRLAEDRGIPHGSDSALPKDRSILTNFMSDRGVMLGEGTLVQLVAQIIEARHSNQSDGESVNCHHGGKEDNDVHVDLGLHSDDPPCSSVTAEISPHFRPQAWSDLVDEDFGNRPIRFTGQLFFDASHKPCVPGKEIRPKRASVWEIHPVYAIDVCRNLAVSRCRASDESAWLPLHEWLGNGERDR